MQQPEALEDPAALGLVACTGDILESLSPFEDVHLAEEVLENLQQLRRGVAESIMQQVARDS